MAINKKTKKELLEEVVELKARLEELEGAKAGNASIEASTKETPIASKRIFRTVLDTIPVRVFWKDLDLNYLGCNIPFALDAGLDSPKELIGKDDFQMSWKDEAELYRADDMNVIATGEAKIDYEEPQTRPDGTSLVLRTSKIPLRDEDGNIFGVLGTYEDITERKEEERRLHLLAQSASSPSGENFFDNLTRHLSTTLNTRYAFVTKMETPDAKKIDMTSIWSGDEHGEPFTYDAAGTPCAEVFNKDALCSFSSNVQESFPEDKWLVDAGIESYMAIPLHDSKGVILGHLGIMDTTTMTDTSAMESILRIFAERTASELERAESQEALANSEEFYRQVITSMSDAVFITDDDGKFTYICPNVKVIFGHLHEEVEAMDNISILLGKEIFDPVRLDNAGEIRNIEHTITTKDGANRDLLANIKRVSIKGGTLLYTCRDVTERKRAEEALKETEERFQSILDNSTAVIYVKDLEGRYLLVNQWYEKLFHVDRDSFKGKTDYDLFPGELADAFRANDIKVLEENAPVEFEEIAPHDDGPHTYISMKFPLYDASGAAYAVCGISTDITERKLAEEELKKLSAAVEQSPATVVITDFEGTIEYVNPKFTEMTGYTAEEAIGENPRILKTGHTTDKEYKELWKTISSGKEWHGEFLNKKKDDSTFWEAASISPIMDERGKITNFIAVKEDITEKKKAESMISRLGRIVDDSLNEVYIFDAETLRYIEANNGARKNLGYSMGELLELTPVDLKPEIDREAFEKIIAPLRTGEMRYIRFQTIHKRKDGSTFPAEIHLQSTTYESSPAFFSIILDVTAREHAEAERERLQAELMQAQKMEAVGVLAAGVAHDFNNILTVIRLRTDSAMSDLKASHPAHADIKEIYDATKTASNLTRQLLLFSRKQSLEIASGNLNDSISGLLKMLDRLIGEDIKITTELAPNLSPALFDKGSIEQVLLNLMVNARDAMPDGGAITIKTENTTLGKKGCTGCPSINPGGYILLSVSDTGEGMDKETASRIFEPFYTTKGSDKGTGLGLSVVYGIATQHKGCIHVESEPNVGTTFYLYLPASTEPAQETSDKTKRPGKTHGEGKRILFVEDEKNLREITSQMLAHNGYKVFEAEDARQAEIIFGKEGGIFNLVISDVVMPGKSGLALVEELLARKPELKVMLSSGYTDDKSNFPLIKEKGYCFLQKPYSTEELLNAVSVAINRKGLNG